MAADTPSDRDLMNIVEGDLLSELPLSTYQVTYRIADRAIAGRNAEERRAGLVSKLQRLQGATTRDDFEDANHISTSCWVVRHRGTAKQLLVDLQAGLFGGFDLLEIIEVIPSNDARLT